MRCRTDFAELMIYLILWSVIKHAHCKTSRVSSKKYSALQAPALKQTKRQYLLGDTVKNPDTFDLFLAHPNIHRKLLQSD